MTASDTDTHYRKQTIPEDGQWARVGHPCPPPSGRVESLAQLHSQRLASRGRRCPRMETSDQIMLSLGVQLLCTDVRGGCGSYREWGKIFQMVLEPG